MQRAGQTPHGARPNREGARNFGSAHAPARRVKPPGRSLEPRSDAGPRGMAVPPGAIRRTEFGLQVRLPQVLIFSCLREPKARDCDARVTQIPGMVYDLY